jgi:hypothetical protein
MAKRQPYSCNPQLTAKESVVMIQNVYLRLREEWRHDPYEVIFGVLAYIVGIGVPILLTVLQSIGKLH